MFGKLGDMMGKMKEMKARMEEVKTKLDQTILDVEGESGSIKVKINGNRIILDLFISPAIQSNPELQKLLLETINKAIKEADTIYESEMKKVAMGMLPGGLF